MPDRVTQAELDEGYRAITDALDYVNARDDLERTLAILGYTVSILLVALKPEARFDAALQWTNLLLDNAHRGILRERLADA